LPSSRFSRLEDKKRPVTFGAIVFIALVAVVMVCLEALSRYQAYSNELESAQVDTVNIARAAAEHAENSVELIDAILFSVVERVEGDRSDAALQARLPRLLLSSVRNTPALQDLFVFDEHGDWILSSANRSGSLTARDRAYFQYHQTHLDRGVHLDRPIRGRASGDWVLPVSRRIEHADGSFAGVALATVPIAYFERYYNDFDLGKQGVVFLSLGDGTLITRRPFVPALVGTSIASGPVFTMLRELGDRGTGMRVSNVDGVERQYSYRKLATLPLVVSAALGKDDILKGWWTQTWRECAVVALLIAVLMFIGSRLFRQILIRDGMALELREMHAALEASVTELDRLARTDSLTGLSNRRCLGERVDMELARASRQKGELALIMIDIDFFKRYNDTYGHVAGDACLRLVSAAIAGATRRPADLAARYGGEEFSILLPDTGLDGGLAVARRICAAVVALQEPHRASEFGIVTISAGVWACMPHSGTTASALFAQADAALYGAKTSGRNQAAAVAGQAATLG
jgi:diguanylate cyclase (GGDEF)-like protein